MAQLYEQIDQGLGRYFQLKGNNDYFGDDGEGLFKIFVEDNGLEEDDDIIDDLGQDDPNECLLMGAFDELDTFPGLPKDISDDEKKVQIRKIIQNCIDDPDAYANKGKKYEALQVEKHHFDVDEKVTKKTTEMYKKQCDTLVDKAMENDKVLLNMIAVGHIKLDAPYLQYLVDMYDRDRVAFINQNDKNKVGELSVVIWAKENPHMKQLARMDMKYAEDVIAAISSYQHRIAPKLLLRPANFIQDSLKDVSEQICAAVIFVHKLAGKKNQTCPFQYDAVFAFNGVERGGGGVGASQFMDDAQDDDDDDDEDEDDQKYFDCFGNIKKKLRDNDRLFVTEPITGSVDDRSRILNVKFVELRNEMSKKYDDETMEEQYPRTHRFCAVIDRRRPPEEQVNNNEDDEKENENEIIELDELIMYEPEKGSAKFPNNKPVPMFYFNTSRKSILPGYDVNGIMDAKQNLIKKTIAAQDPCKGGIMTLSFHVESVDVIRCYLFINGQSIRFMPEDIVLVLPRFFDQKYADNKEWNAEHEDARRYIEEMNKALRDVHFNAFLNKYRTFKL